MKFVMKNNLEGAIHGSYSSKALDIRGQFYASGPQKVEEDGCPVWVAEFFQQYHDVETIAVSAPGRSAVWTRMKP